MGSRELVLGCVALLFLAYMVWRVWPRADQARAIGPEVRAARDRARTAATGAERALALCDAAELAVRGGARWTSAVGFFLRAWKADPAAAEPVTRAIAALRRRRPRVLEKMLWRRLGSLPWDPAHRAVLLVVAGGLRELSEGERRDHVHAAVFRRLEATFREP
jgi:hypothetical protein